MRLDTLEAHVAGAIRHVHNLFSIDLVPDSFFLFLNDSLPLHYNLLDQLVPSLFVKVDAHLDELLLSLIIGTLFTNTSSLGLSRTQRPATLHFSA